MYKLFCYFMALASFTVACLPPYDLWGLGQSAVMLIAAWLWVHFARNPVLGLVLGSALNFAVGCLLPIDVWSYLNFVVGAVLLVMAGWEISQ